MLLTSLLLLQLSAGAPRSVSRADSVAATKLIQRARREETRLFFWWRHEWQKLRDLNGTDPRFWSLHCHFDDAGPEDVYNIITVGSRKSMCPIWFQGYGTRGDENADIDNGIPAKSRDDIRLKRARVIALFDSAARLRPADSWVLGQRVRLNVDQREFVRATLIVADECHASAAFCAMLEGYVLSKSGNRAGASQAFLYAARQMTPADRCWFLDPRVFFDNEDRDRYGKFSCAERDSLDDRFWWLADPLWSERGNERLAVHLERHTLLLLKSSVTVDEHFDWRAKYGGGAVAEMLLRYGWPSVSYHHLEQSDNHYGWLGFRDSTTNASHEYFRPRYHTTPPDLRTFIDLSSLGARPFDLSPPWIPRTRTFDEFWWPIEHFWRPGALDVADYQAAAFRRRRGPLVAVATNPVSPRLEAAALSAYTMQLIGMRSPNDSARESGGPARLEVSGAVVGTLAAKPGFQVISAEVVDQEHDTATAARARFAMQVPPGLDSLRSNALGVSDLVLFTPPAAMDALPVDTHGALVRMLPTTTLTIDRVGVFFELYGLSRSDSVELDLTVVREGEPGLLQRLGSRMGLNDASTGTFAIRWEAGRAGTATATQSIDGASVNMRSILLNLSTLSSGPYTLEISVRSGARTAAVGKRHFVIRR